jgi:hypothetical protein
MTDTESIARARAQAKQAKLERVDRELTALDAAQAAIAAHTAADAAVAADAVQLDAAADLAIDALVDAFGVHEIRDARRASLRIAISAGADRAALRLLAEAARLSRSALVKLPQGRFADLSRGKGWCRRSDGTFANDYRVGPGRWTVGSTDGFRRKDRVTWDVSHVTVGRETWTVAS